MILISKNFNSYELKFLIENQYNSLLNHHPGYLHGIRDFFAHY